MEQTPSDTSVLSAQSTSPSEPQKKPSSKRHIKGGKKNFIEKEVKPNCKLNYEEQLTIVHLIATYQTDQFIIDHIKEKYGKTVTIPNIIHYRYYAAWKPKIEEYRKEFESKIQDEELASKRIRVKELTKHYRKLESEDETMDAVSVLETIREEIEGKTSGSLSMTQYNQYNGLSDEELRKVIDENNRFLEIAEKKKVLELKVEENNAS